MDQTQKQLKEEFIAELMMFSPKYNAVVAEHIANQLTEDEKEQFVTRLSRINDREEEMLDLLEEENPEEYEKKLAEREKAEEEADDAFFSKLEEEMFRATDEVEEKAGAIIDEIDQEEKNIESKIEKEYDRAIDLLKAFTKELEEKEAATPQPQPATPSAPRSEDVIKKELQEEAAKQ